MIWVLLTVCYISDQDDLNWTGERKSKVDSREGARRDPTLYDRRCARALANDLHDSGRPADWARGPREPRGARLSARRPRPAPSRRLAVAQTLSGPPAAAAAAAGPAPAAVRPDRLPLRAGLQAPTRASSKGPALPETATRKAAAAAPPRAPAPRASPRRCRLAPVRARGASPYRQPARLPDGQEVSPLPGATAEPSGKGCIFSSVCLSQELSVILVIPGWMLKAAAKRPELSGPLFVEDITTMVLCKPKLLPLKSLTLEKLEKMHQAAQNTIRQQEMAEKDQRQITH
uniref:BBSome interacting protein 1 n=6 Tax=Catarrhini TaxID=9526 RepID=A0A8I5U6T2_PONAB